MAGYTRQSVSQIINGADITAPPLNAEFNQLLAAFEATTGHGHTGATGDAPQIPLATSVSGFLQAANGGSGGKNNFATSNPTITNDSSQNYAVGSLWINTTTKRIFICASATSSAAEWHEIVANTGTSLTPSVTNTIDIGSSTLKYKDLHLAGNALVGGTLGVTGLSTLASLNSTTSTLGSVTVGGAGNNGSINGVVIGSTNPTAISGTTVAASSGFTGDLTGNVAGNVTASSGTSTFNNLAINGTLTGNLTGGITGNVTATTGSSTFNDVIINGTLNMDAGTTGTIQNLSAPQNNNDAARKIDVDTAVANLVASAPATLDTLNELAAALGDDANFSTNVTASIAAKLPLGGGTMTGAIDMGSQKITTTYAPTNTPDLTNKSYVDTQDALKLSLSGGTMSGAIAMGNNTVSGVPNPTASDHVSNKAYVDSVAGSASAAAGSATAAANSAAAALTSEQNAATHASTAQTSITTAQQFLDTYFVSATAPSGSNLTIGDLWFDTANNLMKVYGSGGFQAAGSSVNGTAERQDYTVGTNSGSYGGSTTVFPATYDPTFCDVFLNGLRLDPSDFTATNGTSVTLGSAANTGDTLAIVSYGTFSLSTHYTQTQSDARYAQLTGATFSGAINMGANDITTTGKILYSNVYSALGDLPSASTYHGMFAHVHGTGKGYYAHGGNWIPLVNEDTSGNVSLGGDLTVTGGLTVNGTQTIINSTTLDVDDLNITVAKGASSAAAANGAGLTVDGASATFNYASTGDKWTMNKPLDVTGNIIVSGTVDGRDIATDGTALDKLTGFSIITTNATVTKNTRNACDVSSSAFTLTLPSSANTGDFVEVRQIAGDFSVNNLTVAGNGNNINGDATLVVDVAYAQLALVYNGTEWRVS